MAAISENALLELPSEAQQPSVWPAVTEYPAAQMASSGVASGPSGLSGAGAESAIDLENSQCVAAAACELAAETPLGLAERVETLSLLSRVIQVGQLIVAFPRP